MGDKPTISIDGQDGNVFAVIGAVKKALTRNGQAERATEFLAKTKECKNYDEVLTLTMGYVVWE